MAAENSIITLYRRQKLCQITSGAITSIPKITHVAFGDGGMNGSGEPIPPAIDAAGLANEIARYPIDGVTYPLDPLTTARYTATVPANALPGASISEAALVDDDGKVCAIRTFFVKRKDAGVTFTFTFDDEF